MPNLILNEGYENNTDLFFGAQDEKIFIAVQHRQQFIALSSYQENGDRLSIGYYPSRFLACRKIATLQNTQNIAATVGI